MPDYDICTRNKGRNIKTKLKKFQEWLAVWMIMSGDTNMWERKQNQKNIYDNLTPDYDICTRNKSGNIKTRQMLEAN